MDVILVLLILHGEDDLLHKLAIESELHGLYLIVA
jgi:hypothetical protein